MSIGADHAMSVDNRPGVNVWLVNVVYVLFVDVSSG